MPKMAWLILRWRGSFGDGGILSEMHGIGMAHSEMATLICRLHGSFEDGVAHFGDGVAHLEIARLI